MFTQRKVYRFVVPFVIAWQLVSCSEYGQTATSSDVKLAMANNVLAGTHWTECRLVLAVGTQYFFNKRRFDFTADGRMVVSPQEYYSDQTCVTEISPDQVTKVPGSRSIPTGGYEHRYNIAFGPNGQGVYAFDMIVYGQTTYTSMRIDGNHLMIASAYNLDTDDPAELAMTGISPATRAYTFGKLPLYYSLYRLP